ncbi:ABC transporter permease subunit [Paenibacillus sp. PL2-23]|uniref:ABC transporter permease n=1 Tax=Paenibacillus sp. PL2-23 TaxID=2100729 RepID=UPI0030FBC60D
MKASAWKTFVKNKDLLLIMTPGLLKIFIFAYLPMIGVVLAFKDFRYDLGIFGSEWVGFKNFEFFFNSQFAFRLIRNTILYELGYMIITTLVALVLAVLLNEISSRFTKLYQTSMFLPYFLSWIVVYYVVYAFLDMKHGLVNNTLVSLGLEAKNWYLDSAPWPYLLNIISLWKKIGFSMLVYYAGILAINQEYYEAARIDGASRFQMAVRITIPVLMPLVSILLILSIGGMMSGDFGLHYFIPGTSGLTYPTTDIIDTFVYRALTEIGNVGMGAAVGFFQSAVGLVLVLLANYIVRLINEENSLW